MSKNPGCMHCVHCKRGMTNSDGSPMHFCHHPDHTKERPDALTGKISEYRTIQTWNNKLQCKLYVEKEYTNESV